MAHKCSFSVDPFGLSLSKPLVAQETLQQAQAERSEELAIPGG